MKGHKRIPLGSYVVLLLLALCFSAQIHIGNQHAIIQNCVLHSWSGLGIFGYMWLHLDVMHLLESMLLLWVFGRKLSMRLGFWLFLGLYIGTGMGAGVTHLLFDSRPAVGASGAVMGVLGVYVAICYRDFSRWGPVLVCFWFFMSLTLGILGMGPSAHLSHTGGFVMGLVLAGVLLAWGA